MEREHLKKAQDGLLEIEGAILGLLNDNPDGLINNEIARRLGLESDFMGRQRNYLTYSVLGGMIRKGLVLREKVGHRQPFKVAARPKPS